jgi:hypothetical protein
MKNNRLKNPFMLRLTFELTDRIDLAFHRWLKKSGTYITKAEFIRRAILKGIR